jgi:hypothetical protein
MPTYFGYVERDEDNFINWAEIGKTMTDTLQNVNRVREEKKALIDQASREYAKQLSNHPVGQDDNANAGVIEHADNASKFMLMQDRLLKQGIIKLKDYTTARQNLMDDTDNFFATMKAYNEVYAKKMERQANNESSSFEPWSMAFVEKFGDFNKAGAYINPMTGNVNMAMKREEIGADGKKVFTMDNNPSETASVGVLKRIVDMTVDRYKMNDETTAIAETIGVQIDSMIKNGAVTSTEDIRNRNYQGQSPVLASKAATGNALLELTDDEKKSITFTETTTDAKGVETKTSLALAGNETNLADKYHEAINTNPDDRTTEQRDVINKVNTVLAKKIESTKGVSFNYEEAETNLINASITTNPYRIMSVLSDNKRTADNGKQYYYERDSEIAAKKPEAILVVSENGKLVPKLTPKQEKDAVEYVRSGVRAKLKYEEKQFAFKQDATDSRRKGEDRAPSQWETKRYDEAMNTQDFGNEAAKLYAGDDNTAGTAIEFFQGSEDVDSILRSETGITIYFQEDSKGVQREETISFFNRDGTERGVDSFVRAVSRAILGNDANADQAVAGSKEYLGKPLNRNLTVQGNLPFKQAGEKVISMLPEDIFKKGQKEAAKLLEQQLSGLGLEIGTAGTAENWVKIKAPGTTKSIKVQTNWYDDRNNKLEGNWPAKRKENYDLLVDYLRKNLTKYTKDERNQFKADLNENIKSRTPKKTPANPPAKPAKPAGNAAPRPK